MNLTLTQDEKRRGLPMIFKPAIEPADSVIIIYVYNYYAKQFIETKLVLELTMSSITSNI